MLQQPDWATRNRWWLLKSLPGEAESHSPPTVARDNGLLFRELAPPQAILLKTIGSSHCLLSLTSSSFLNLLQAGPHPRLFHWENTLLLPPGQTQWSLSSLFAHLNSLQHLMLATFPSFLSRSLSFWSVLFLSSASSFTPSSFYLSSALEFHLNIGLPELLSDFSFPPLLFSTYIIYWSPSSRFSVLTSTEIFPVCISSSVSQADVTVLKAAETSGDGEKVCLTWTRDNKMRKGVWDQLWGVILKGLHASWIQD